MPERALSPKSLGAWLVKASPGEHSVDELVRRGFATTSDWCVRPTYRADLVARGQRVLLWVSGRDAGIYAQGVTTGPAGTSTGRLAMPVSLEPVDPPVLRSDVMAHPVLSRVEVVRMPAGSNPSYLTRAELDALADDFPQVRR